MADYQSIYTGKQIDSGVGGYTYATTLSGTTGDIYDDENLYYAISMHAPITLTITINNSPVTLTFEYMYRDGPSNSTYFGKYDNGQKIINCIMHFTDISMSLTSWEFRTTITMPVPDGVTDRGKVLAASSTNGLYELITVNNVYTYSTPLNDADHSATSGEFTNAGLNTAIAAGDYDFILSLYIHGGNLSRLYFRKAQGDDQYFAHYNDTDADYIIHLSLQAGANNVVRWNATGNIQIQVPMADDAGKALIASSTIGKFEVDYPAGVSYVTSAPSAANTSGALKFAVLSTEPSTKYSGWVYFITG